MTFGYDANVSRLWDAAGSNVLYDHAKSLEYQLDQIRPSSSCRPIFFVAHSLGGLVCKQLLLLSDMKRESDGISNNTMGILFMGTPNYESNLRNWAEFLTNFTTGHRATDTDINTTIQRGSFELRRVDEEFQGMLKRPDVRIKIVSFYEVLPMGSLGRTVESDSAILRNYESYSIHGDHETMTKFSGTNDVGFEAILRTLTKWIDLIESQVYRKADATKHATKALDSGEANTSKTTQVFNNYGKVSGRNIIQGQHLSGGTNTWNFS
jgi:protein SERAC1